MAENNVDLVIVGSVGIDTIETPTEKQEEILGGSVSYACAAASFFTHTGMVGVVGTDFPQEFLNTWENMSIDLEGLQKVEGKTFRWSGVYEENMDNRRTLSTELNVFETFSPELPENYREAPYLFLGNIHPALQLHVLEQVHRPDFILIDTMDLWINIDKEDLEKVISKCHMLTLNESEAQLFTGEFTLKKAADRLLELGPEYVLVKKGGNGSVLFTKDDIFLLHAYPLDHVKDPTGAGDTFAGGLMGAIAAIGRTDRDAIRQAMVYGSIVASFGVEEFSLQRLTEISLNDIEVRASEFREMCELPDMARLGNYQLTFEDRGSYLFAHIAGDDSFAASLSYWNEIAGKVSQLGRRKLLIHEELRGEVNENEMRELLMDLTHSGLKDVRIAFFDEDRSHMPINAVGQTLSASMGGHTRIFDSLEAARQWIEKDD
jgi:sugar/nucleoside kinase (ribokinase family)